MRVSVVGCGAISNNHLKALKGLHNVEISSVVDIRKDRADAAAKKYHCKAFRGHVRDIWYSLKYFLHPQVWK